MSYRNETEAAVARRGRPRDEQVEQRILGVVGAVLAEHGYDGVTFEEVARRSGASKATLYRRWRTRREMVIAALKAGPSRRDEPDAIDTGTLRGDLLALARRLDTTMRSADGQTPLLLLQAGLEDPELCEAIETAAGPTGARLPRSVLDAAVARGELPDGVDPFPYEEVVGSALLLRRLNGLRVDDDYLAALIDTVLLPALRATVRRDRPLPAGIFSGSPALSTLDPAPKETP